MLQPDEFLAAKRLIQGLPRPNQVLDVFTEIMVHVQPNTGKVAVTRATVAQAIGIAPENVGRALASLARVGLLRNDGTKARPEYYMAPSVVWRGSEDRRQASSRAHTQAVVRNSLGSTGKVVPLRLVVPGGDDDERHK